MVKGILVVAGLVLAAGCASAQVRKCELPNGRITYTDAPCPDGSTGTGVNTTANVLDGSSDRVTAARVRDEQAIRESSPAEAATFNSQSDADRQRSEAFKAATTPLPGSRGSLTRAQREAAASLARTQQERGQLMREASTPLPGSPGGALTASQLDAQRRLSAANRGESTPPPSARPDPPPTPTRAAPEPPTSIVNCDPAGCWDAAGRRYNNAAGGNFSRSDGKFCTRTAPDNVICN